MNNKKAIDKGLVRAKAIINERMSLVFVSLGRYLLTDAFFRAEYSNLTGNTITSLAFGLYDNYKLQEVFYIDGVNSPLRVKLTLGETLVDYIDYDGKFRKRFTATVDTDGKYGYEFSLDFLSKFRPTFPKSIVMTTGTEYSEFIEKALFSNVLTETSLEVKMNGLSYIIKELKSIR